MHSGFTINAFSKTKHKVLGKSDARKQFLPLVNSLAKGAAPVEITDYGKVVAVLVSKNDFDRMSKNVNNVSKPKRRLCGLGRLLGDLEEGSKEIAKSIEESLKRTADSL